MPRPTVNSRAGRLFCGLTFLLGFAVRAEPAAPAGAVADDDAMEDVTKLPAYNVTADRLEEFGFRVSGRIAIPGRSY